MLFVVFHKHKIVAQWRLALLLLGRYVYLRWKNNQPLFATRYPAEEEYRVLYTKLLSRLLYCKFNIVLGKMTAFILFLYVILVRCYLHEIPCIANTINTQKIFTCYYTYMHDYSEIGCPLRVYRPTRDSTNSDNIYTTLGTNI